MRLFTGLDLPVEVVAEIEKTVRQLKPAAKIQWSPPANLHVTTKFIGHWPEQRLEELKAALAGLPGRSPIQATIRGLGFYPNPRAPRVFWCGIEAPGLADLAADTDTATGLLGIEREKRPYSPHLTLARIKAPSELTPLHDAVARLESLEFGSFQAASFFLYQSAPRPGGSVYTKLAEFLLHKS